MRLEELIVYNLAVEYGEEIWNVVIGWETFPRIHLGGQMVAAADSISFNIAEGFGRFHYKENKQFCYYARGSIMESKTGIQKAIKRKLISEKEYQILLTKLETIPLKLNAISRASGQKNQKSKSALPMTTD